MNDPTVAAHSNAVWSDRADSAVWAPLDADGMPGKWEVLAARDVGRGRTLANDFIPYGQTDQWIDDWLSSHAKVLGINPEEIVHP